MPYTALYRQWRPQTFSDVIGQSHVTVTLQNALKSGKIGHAYLFAGPRGTGKTSVAKILARAVNCVEGPGPEPCNRCAACVSILDGSATDVLEIDAASNRGIDEIRDLRSGVRFCPAGLRYRVYIIDEVHMLTPEAFNALLKTLEEPPSHAIFILATTEPHRLPATILSRCQRFSFHRISTAQVAQRLESLAGSSGLKVSADALRLIARASDGSLRDALGLLEQCAAYAGAEIGAEHVRTILGDAGPECLLELARAIQAGNLKEILGGLDASSAAGKDFRRIARDLCRFFRDLLVIKVCSDPAGLLDEDPETVRSMSAIASGYSREEILRIIATLGEVESQMRYSSNPRVCLEVGLVRIAGAVLAGDQSSTAAGSTPAATPAQEPAPARAPAPPQHGPEPAAAVEDAAADLPAADVASMWPSLMSHLKRERKAKVAALLEPAAPLGFDGGVLVLAFRPDAQFHKTQMEAPGNLRVLETALRAVTGRDMRVRCVIQRANGAGGFQGNDAGHGSSGAATTCAAGAGGEGTGEDPEIARALEMFGGKLVEG